MPVEIRELIIKATVVENTGGKGTSAKSTSGNDVTTAEEIINACIEKIIQIEKDKKER